MNSASDSALFYLKQDRDYDHAGDTKGIVYTLPPTPIRGVRSAHKPRPSTRDMTLKLCHRRQGSQCARYTAHPSPGGIQCTQPSVINATDAPPIGDRQTGRPTEINLYEPLTSRHHTGEGGMSHKRHRFLIRDTDFRRKIYRNISPSAPRGNMPPANVQPAAHQNQPLIYRTHRGKYNQPPINRANRSSTKPATH
jgi:hypothetical protein